MTAPVFDASGKPVDVPVDPGQLIQGGGMVAVVGPTGWRGTIPVERLSEAMKNGFRPESGGEFQDRQLEAKYGDSALRAGVEGAARGLTFGLSDAALAGLGADEEGLRERQARNPIASTIGEVGGAVAGLGLTGIGGLAERAGAAAFGAPGILARAGAAAVRGGVEGLSLGAGQGVSQLALSRDPLTAESIVGTLGHDALVGALTGGAISGGLSVAGAGLKAATGAAGKALEKTGQALREELTDTGTGIRPGHEDLAPHSLDALNGLEKTETDAIKARNLAAGQVLAEDIGNFREGIREEWTKLQTVLPKGQGIRQEFNEAEKALKRVLRIPKNIAEEPKKALDAIRMVQEQASKFESFLPKGILEGAEATTPEAIAAGAKQARFAGKAASIAEKAEALENRVMDLSSDASKTSDRLEAIQARKQALLAPERKTPVLNAMTKGIGGAIGGAIGHAIPVPYAGVAGAWLGSELSKAVLKPVMQKILGAYAENAGAIAESSRALFSKLTPPASVQSALSDLANAAGATAATSPTAPDRKSTTFLQATQAIQQAAANPDAIKASLAQGLSGIAAMNPDLASQAVDKYQLRLNFLASKIPPTTTMGVGGQTIPPSDAEQSKWGRFLAAANDPLRIIKELASKSLMPETVETHEALFPEHTAQIKSALTEALSDPAVAGKIPYTSRIDLAMLLGPSVDATLAPVFVGTMQSTFDHPPYPPSPPPQLKPPTGAQTAKTSASFPPTEAQRLTMQ